MNYKETALYIMSELGYSAELKDYNSDGGYTKPVDTNMGAVIGCEVYKYGNSDNGIIEITFELDDSKANANRFIDLLKETEGLSQPKGEGHYGLHAGAIIYSPWSNHYLLVRIEVRDITDERHLDKGVQDALTLAKMCQLHLEDWAALRVWSEDDEEVKAKAREIIEKADFEERDFDWEYGAHWLHDRNSFIKGWFNPFDYRGKGSWDIAWPSSLDYAARNMGQPGSFEYAVACVVLQDDECIRKAKKGCRIHEETIKVRK